MYLFSKEEIQKIKELIVDISPSLRGWNLTYKFSKLKPLNIAVIANTYCDTDRKIYQIYKGVDYGTSEAMITGAVIHSLVEEIFNSCELELESKSSVLDTVAQLKDENSMEQLIWNGGKLQQLRLLCSSDEEYDSKIKDLKTTMKDVVDFEAARLTNPEINNKIWILDIEKSVSGFSLNMGNGKIDVVLRNEGNIGIGDLKTGRPWGDNRDAKIQMTIYALLLESEAKNEVNWGAVIFPFDFGYGSKFLRKTPLKDIFGIDDEVRMDALQRLSDVEKLLSSDKLPELCGRCRTKELCSMVI